MYRDAELVLTSYKPLKLEKGMMFVQQNSVGEVIGIYELDKDINTSFNIDLYMTINGCPVEASLYEWSLSSPLSNQLAINNEIGWIDDGDELHEITLEDFNTILRNKMRCQVEIIDSLSSEICIPVFDEEKVIIRLIEEENEDI